MRFLATVALLITSLCSPSTLGAGTGRQADETASKTAAFLFEYEALPGLESRFEDGYRRHLDWHRAAKDPLDWYAWYVVTGPRVGRFVDGTFNLSFQDFDRRVDPAGDRADARVNVSPYARPVSRLVYRLRPDLGTSVLFQDDEPTAMIEAVRVQARPGREPFFEKALRDLVATAAEDQKLRSFSCYQLFSGGPRPTYLLLIPRRTWAEVGVADGSALGLGESADLSSVERIESETWAFRPDLTYRSE